MEFAHACKGLGREGDHRRGSDARRRIAPHPARRRPHRLLQPLPAADRGARSTRAPTRASARRRTPRSSRSSARRGPRLPVRLCARRRGRSDMAPRLLAAFGRERFRVELQRPFWRRDRARNRTLAQLAERLGVPCVATGNVHSHHPDRARLQDAFVAVRLLSTPRPDRAPAARQQLVGDGLPRPRWRRASPTIPTRSPRPRGSRSGSSSTSRATSATAIPARRIPSADRKLAELCGARLDERYPRNGEQRRGTRAAWTRSCA